MLAWNRSWGLSPAFRVVALSLGFWSVVLGVLPARAQVFDDSLAKTPELKRPEPASVAGAYAKTAFGPAEMSRGTYSLPGTFSAPESRGPIQANIFPTYAPENGLSEWGMGWANSLVISRFQELGDIDYETDQFTTPWGKLIEGQDGHYYLQAFKNRSRLTLTDEGFVAVTPEGTRYLFTPGETTDRGTYSWVMSRVESILGDVTELTWSHNESGRPFLQTVTYGGRGTGRAQMQVVVEYETLVAGAGAIEDYRSGELRVLDRRVKAVIIKARRGGTGDFTVRYTDHLSHELSPYGPAFYLVKVEREFASGERAPAQRYTYDYGYEGIEALEMQPTTAFDAVLRKFGITAFQPSQTSRVDVDADGQDELEHHLEQQVIRFDGASFVWEDAPARPDEAHALCRPAKSQNNPARNLMRLRPEDFDARVFRVLPSSSQSRVLVCSREGLVLHDQRVSGLWDTERPDMTVADINRDGRPDVVRVSQSGYQVLLNLSAADEYRFEAQAPVNFQTRTNPTGLWVQDFNGDSIGDLIVRHSSGIQVFYGLGGATFTPKGRNYRFMSQTGRAISPAGYQVTFLDANRDGLSDALLSKGSNMHLFVNTGEQFEYVAVDALNKLKSNGYVMSGDLFGTGETDIFFISSAGSYRGSLSTPGTGLLEMADDGKGTRLFFEYNKAPAEPGIFSRPTVLEAMSVASAGYDTVSYVYDYEGGRVHSRTRGLLGFAMSHRTSPLLFEEVAFHHEDSITGIVLGSSTRDLVTDYEQFSENEYEPRSFEGIAYMRPLSARSGFRTFDGASEVFTNKRFTAYDAEFCSARIEESTPHGVLVRETLRDDSVDLRGAMHCVNGRESVAGTHTDESLDFSHSVRFTRNALGQIETAIGEGADGDLELQRVRYDALARVEGVSAPGKGETVVAYDPATGAMNEVIAPEGVALSVGGFDPITDAMLEMSQDRGAGRFSVEYRYDGQERLKKSWDNLGVSSEQSPLAQYGYQYASGDAPGWVESRTLMGPMHDSVDDRDYTATQTAAKLFAADGEELASALRIPEGLSFGAVKRTQKQTGENTSHYKAPTAGELDDLTYGDFLSGGDELEYSLQAGLGYASVSRRTVQKGVQQQVRTRRELAGQTILQTVTENDTLETQTATASDGKVLWAKDGEGFVSRFSYDALGRVVGIALPGGEAHRLRYDSYGRPELVEREGLVRFRYAYDPGTGLAIEKTVERVDGTTERSESLVHDEKGRVVRETHTLARSGAQETLEYIFDGDEGGPKGQLGHLTEVRGKGFVKRFEHDQKDQVRRAELVLEGFRTISEQHDYYEDGSQKALVTTVSSTEGELLQQVKQEWLHDEYGRIKAMDLGGKRLFGIEYDAEGKASLVRFTSGEVLALHYDQVTRNPSGYYTDAGGWNASVDYELNERGLIAKETMAFGDQYWERKHSYDGRGYLTSSTDEEQLSQYQYGPSGLVTEISDVQGMRAVTAVNGGHRGGEVIVGAGDGQKVYDFDPIGRLEKRDGVTFFYGPRGELDRAKVDDGSGTLTEVSYRYDEADQRILKLRHGKPEIAYLGDAFIDHTRLVVPVKVASRLVGIIVNGEFEILATDPRGTLLGEDGLSNLPSPYGVRARRPELSEVLDFVEKGIDKDIGTVRFGVRDYDPYLGQFTTPDPLFLEDLEKCVESPTECNLYSYAANNPVNVVDPTGMFGEYLMDGEGNAVAAPEAVTAAPTTESLPSISAGTPAAKERPHAAAEDLVPVDARGNVVKASPTKLTPEAATAFRLMRQYAERDGIDVSQRLKLFSGFRSDSRQAELNAREPESLASGGRARAGGSTHRTGNAMDITVASGNAIRNQTRSLRDALYQDPAAQWVERNAPKFGFEVLGVLRDSSGSVRGHAPHWEPWHLTYNRSAGTMLPPAIK